MRNPDSFFELVGYDLGTRNVTWSERDVILYAIACGARGQDLDLVYERDLRPLPGFVATLGLWAVERCGDLGLYDRRKSLHVSQKIEIHSPIARAGTVPARGVVQSVLDKGKATIIDVVVECEVFSATYSIFLPGIGGWGGQSQPASPRADAAPELRPVASFQTSRQQAVLYRLTGDLHPVHVDYELARGYGFDRPILHGLCTLGIVLRELGAISGHHPADLVAATARLSAPVFPGDTLEIRSVATAGDWAFDACVGDRVVLKEGWAKFASIRGIF